MQYAPNLRRSVSIAILIIIFLPNASFSQQFQDCSHAFPVCNKQTYYFNNMIGTGLVNDDIGKLSCSRRLQESNSIWLKFSILQSGVLTFIIDPMKADDDIDFVLFRKEGTNCNNLKEIRCMAAGETTGQLESRNVSCKGATGLSYQSIDEFERSGCKYESDNFLKYLAAEKDEEYYLFVNNYHGGEGFSISFDGDMEFKEIENCLQYVKEEPLAIASIVPNPAKNYIDIFYHAVSMEEIKLDVFSMEGRLQATKSLNPLKDDQSYRLDIENMTAANYLLRFTQAKYSTIRQFTKI